MNRWAQFVGWLLIALRLVIVTPEFDLPPTIMRLSGGTYKIPFAASVHSPYCHGTHTGWRYELRFPLPAPCWPSRSPQLQPSRLDIAVNQHYQLQIPSESRTRDCSWWFVTTVPTLKNNNSDSFHEEVQVKAYLTSYCSGVRNFV